MRPRKTNHSYRNMPFGKFRMARMPYSGWIPGSKCHPYQWTEIYNPMKITFKILSPSKWQICDQIPPATFPGEAGNQPIEKSKWQWIVTCSTGNKQNPKGEYRKAQTKTFSDGDTHLMESSLSRRDTIFKRNSITFRKIASGQQYGNQIFGPKSLRSSGFYFTTRS